MDLKQLPTTAVLSDYVTVCECDGIKVIRILHPKVEAAVSLFGGHLLSYKPSGQKDVIWLSKKAILTGAKPIRGGIPVCWPWFGKSATPAHGFARNSQWKLEEHRENETGVIVSLTLEDSDETRAIWPYRFKSRLQFEFGAELSVSLTGINTDDKSWSMGGALHTYFNVADIDHTAISGLGNEYIDSTQAGARIPSTGTTDFSGETDRIYTAPGACITIEDKKQPRRIHIKNSGDNAAVVWNPWNELSESMADMADDGYQTMVCVESTIHDTSVVLQPGESHTLSTKISTD